MPVVGTGAEQFAIQKYAARKLRKLAALVDAGDLTVESYEDLYTGADYPALDAPTVWNGVTIRFARHDRI